MSSSRWTMCRDDWAKVFNAILWSGASSAIVAIPVIVNMDMQTAKATALIIAVAFVNGSLVGLKKFAEEKGKLLP